MLHSREAVGQKTMVYVKYFMVQLLAFIAAAGLHAQPEGDTAAIKLELGEVRITAREHDIGSAVLDQEKMKEFNRTDVAGALDLIPGINFVRLGPKNESMVNVRGFDIRQVPVYLDGVPVYTPYDGYMDLGRFLLQDLARITVSKGVSSVLYGPNTMGGAINLVTRRPVRGFELDGSSGIKAGSNRFEGYRSDLRLGGRSGHYYYQLAYALGNLDSYALSHNYEPVFPGDDRVLDNSYRRDLKVDGKLGFTPNETDEYVLNFIHQHGEKGVPVYHGENPAQPVRYWRFPAVDKQGVNFLSSTAAGRHTTLKTRLYLDRYYSDLRSYDSADYSKRAKRSSFTSIYLDDSYGGNVALDHSAGARHQVKAVVHYKFDHHREHNSYPVEETVRHFMDVLFSAGLEETFFASQKVMLTGGLSYNAVRNIRADDYDARNDSVHPFPGNGYAAINAQLGLAYRFSSKQELGINLARKSRFATMKDRYSYRLGMSLPNPLLDAEYGLHGDISHTFRPAGFITLHTSVFFSLLNDVIQRVDGVEPSDPALYQFRNTGRAEFYGLETECSLNPYPSLEANLQYSYLEMKNLSRPSVLFTDVPRHKVFGYLKYSAGDRTYVLFSSDFNSRRYSTSDGKYAAGAFFAANIQSSIRVWKSISLEAGVMNLFDAGYSYMEGYPEEGRNYFISLRYRTH